MVFIALYGWDTIASAIVKLFPSLQSQGVPQNQGTPAATEESCIQSVLPWVLWGIVAYGWLWPAWAALRRAKRIGESWRAFYRGVTVAFAFVSSLFGSFWAATSLLRSYFFDPRIVPLLLIAVGLAVTSGCTTSISYGEVRRRELFHAMLIAWTLGLALMWRWWSRGSGTGNRNSPQ